jgi:hypothetical protein
MDYIMLYPRRLYSSEFFLSKNSVSKSLKMKGLITHRRKKGRTWEETDERRFEKAKIDA